jgi:hypothetical protein
MVAIYSTHKRNWKCVQKCLNLKIRGHLEDLDVDRRKIFKWTSKNICVDLAVGRYLWWAFVNSVMNLSVT